MATNVVTNTVGAQAEKRPGSGVAVAARWLLALEIFLAGGFVALMLVRQLLLTIMARLVSAVAQAEILKTPDATRPPRP